MTEKVKKQMQDRSGFDFSIFTSCMKIEGTQELYLEFLTEEKMPEADSVKYFIFRYFEL